MLADLLLGLKCCRRRADGFCRPASYLTLGAAKFYASGRKLSLLIASTRLGAARYSGKS